MKEIDGRKPCGGFQMVDEAWVYLAEALVGVIGLGIFYFFCRLWKSRQIESE